MPRNLPSFEQWRSTLADMVLFHQEQGLPWLWMPTPAAWMENLHAQETEEQGALRRVLVMRTTPQPPGLVWYAWDTRDKTWIEDGPMLAQWYSHWAAAQDV